MKRFPSIVAVALLAGTLVSTASCFFTSGTPTEPAKPAVAWLWPEPPEQPRIQFIQTVITPKDLGIKKGFFRRLWEFIAGENAIDRIESPRGVVSDGKGGVYIADWAVGLVHYFNFREKEYDALNKTKLGPLASPIGVALDEKGRVYVSDSFLNRVFVFSGTKNKLVIGDDSLLRPTGIAVNISEKRLYVVDTLGQRVDVFTLDGKKLFSFGSRGSGEGEFNYPTYMALDRSGNVYVMDTLNFRVQIFDHDGKFLSQFGGTGTGYADFIKPKGISVDNEGHIWISDSMRNSIQVFDRQGELLLIFGKQGTGPGEFHVPAGLFSDGNDRLFVADSYNYRLQVYQYLKTEEKKVPETVPSGRGVL